MKTQEHSKMQNKRWKKRLLLFGLLAATLAGAVFCYQDYYTLKEADIILFAGQSNMSGAGGNAEEAPELIKGAGYEYRAITAPDALTVLTEPFGEKEHKEGYLDDRELIPRAGSLVTAFVNSYYENAKERVVAVSASRGSAQISSFNNYLVEDVIERLEGCKAAMTAQTVNIRHIYLVWFQGETDAYTGTSAEQYIGGMQNLLHTLQPYGVEKCFVIQIGNVTMGGEKVDTSYLQQVQEQLCEEDENFILISTLPQELEGEEYTEDGIHFNQTALNLIGEDAGNNMGIYVKTLTEGRK